MARISAYMARWSLQHSVPFPIVRQVKNIIMGLALHCGSKKYTMADQTTEEASIEPQVKQETPLVEVGVAASEVTQLGDNVDGGAGPVETNGNNERFVYSTRSKDKLEEKVSRSELKQKELNVIVHPRLKPVPFKNFDISNEVKAPAKQYVFEKHGIQFHQSEEHPFNKRGFKYKPCNPNHAFSSNLYSTTDLPPFAARVSYFDRSQGILFNDNMDTITTTDGWRSARGNVGIREGKYYLEFEIIDANNGASDKGHIRVGFARREASLDAPVGFDGYGYGIRDINGQKLTLSRPTRFMKDCKDIESAGFKSGDVIGFLIELPPLREHKKHVDNFLKSKLKKKEHGNENKVKKKNKTKKNLPVDSQKLNQYDNILRDQIPIKYKNALYYEQYEYTSIKKMDHLLNPVTVFGEKAILENANNTKESLNIPTIPNSKIRVFKNGIDTGVMFENLYSFLPTDVENEEQNLTYNTRQQSNPNYHNTDDGSLGYYPILSAFQKGIVKLNPGPNFNFPLAENYEGVRPYSERYDEQVVDEAFWDLIDEVEAEYLDSFEV
ncbi:Piso0_000110 [Millerozyma farinosa CBS 7064]|uniref:Piso0_000110 protein n=1 Tax=Pichia sorbitophila (strain ATCC MYA-4447 / BCRC 22081 / CBS 7064 / NBRC 10061 / NRRL Y-12695) TaxID=559304 RepID=G8YT42_PICSO|nr:Piso0_000110 [Millerozyma farinosa CBS 7064]